MTYAGPDRRRVPEVCVEAAIRLEDGTVVRGRRHHNCFQNASEQGHSDESIRRSEQGFVTSRGRFVDRRVGRCIQEMAGVPSAAPEGYRYDILFSEDLY
jgi:hypothetical protein